MRAYLATLPPGRVEHAAVAIANPVTIEEWSGQIGVPLPSTDASILDDDGQPVGLTANSFNSVSLDPPLVLWSLARKSPNLDQFVVGRQHAIHVLSDAQKDLAYHFAAPKPDKFAGVDHVVPADFKAPILAGATACFYCETHQLLDGDIPPS